MSFSAADFTDSPTQTQAAATPTAAATTAAKPNTVVSATPTSSDAGAFSAADFADGVTAPSNNSTNTQTGNDGKDSVAQHGLLRRAWDFINSPIADLSVAGHRILPEGVKTADLVKAAAFEKMYGEAYIPGYNDFDTKAEEHFGPAPAKMTTKRESNGIEHPYVAPPESHAFKNAVRTFIAGSAKDASDMAASFTSPVGIATTLAGVGPEAKAGSALAKVAPVAKVLTGTAFGAKGVHDIYTAGTDNSPEAWQQRLQGAAELTGGATLAGEPIAESGIVGKAAGTAGRVVDDAKNVVKGGQPKLQPAIRGAAQTAADLGAARPAIELATEDAHPVSIEYDENGNVLNFDGRHRVMEAIKNGDEKIAVRRVKPDGFDTVEVDPKLVAQHVGVDDASLANTDTRQSYRAGNGQPRQAETKIVGKQTEGAPALEVKPDASMRNVLQDVSEDIQGRGKQIYQALDKATDNKFTTYTDRLSKINDRLSDLIPDTTEADDSAIERLEQQKSELETSQAQMFENLKDGGIDPKIVDDAKAHWRQAMALRDVDQALRMSTTGNAGFGAREVVDPTKLVNRLEKLNVARDNAPSRLEQAFGKEGADSLMKDAYAAGKAKRTLTYAKWAAGIASGLGLLHGDLAHLAQYAGSLVP